MKVLAAAATHVGMVRDHNEDAYLLESPLFVVADGMGGHNGGEIASGTTIETFHHAYKGLTNDPNPIQRLAEVAQAANRTVFTKASADPELDRMGTTLTAALARAGRIFVAHIGDSRCYRLRDGRLDQLTVDHTLVGEFVREGKITEEQARTHPQRSIITRALGVEPAVPVDSITIEVAEGDRFLLCSDGLYGMLYDEEIKNLLVEIADPQQCSDALIEAANRAGGDDNTTVLIIDIIDPTADEEGGDASEQDTDQFGVVGPGAGGGGGGAGARSWALWMVILLLILFLLAGFGWIISRQSSAHPAGRPVEAHPRGDLTEFALTGIEARRTARRGTGDERRDDDQGLVWSETAMAA